MSNSKTAPTAHRLTVHPSGDALVRGEVQTFLLADTLWAAFSRMSHDEWRDTLRLRRRQGFNAVNISILPIAHDQSMSNDVKVPFHRREDGTMDLNRPNADYFANAQTMVDTALSEGFTPILVVLWCNYVPNTWGAALTPELVLNQVQTERYLDMVLERFADPGVIFCISGDERFDDDVATSRYHLALQKVRQHAPQCLTTLHSTPDATLPALLADDPALDYYSYQAGHDVGWDQRALEMPQQYHRLPSHKPVVSMEPCYEGHGWGAGRWRHDATSVRLASWTGVIAGAGAGLGYAAHGAWSWHHAGDQFNGAQFSGTPFPAQRALELPGAWDVGLLRRIVEQHSLFALRSRDDLLLDHSGGARLGMSKDGHRIAVYLPHPFSVQVGVDLTNWHLEVWDLSRGRRDHVRVHHASHATTFEQPDFLGDALFVLVDPEAST